MKLVVFNKENCVSDRSTGTPKISLNSKTGVVLFNKAMVARLELKEGDQIAFAQNPESPKDWYLQVGENESNFQLREKDGNLSFNSTTLVRKIFDSVSYMENTSFVLLGSPQTFDGVEWYLVITSTIKPKIDY